jgi:hypothetical protein
MSRLRPQKLHVAHGPRIGAEEPVSPRVYTLTHSDLTGDLLLTVASTVDKKQISGLYARLMRDEVLAEWRTDQGAAELHVHCHISGGLALGSPGMRLAIFRREMQLVLEALRFGDRDFFAAHPALDQAPIVVHFHAREPRYNRVERYGVPADYRHPQRNPALQARGVGDGAPPGE